MKHNWLFDESFIKTATSRGAQVSHYAEGLAAATGPETALTYGAAHIPEIEAIAASFGTVETVVLIGIGGSSLGAEAIHRIMAPRDAKIGRLIVLDTVNPFMVTEAVSALSSTEALAKSAIVIASKSGSTLETLANANALISRLSEIHPEADVMVRTLFLTLGDSELAKRASEGGGRIVPVPEAISGRMSIGTETGLVPLALLGIDTAELMAGFAAALAEESIRHTLNSALVLTALYDRGIRIRELVMPDPTFEGLGKWSRQLIAESLGKAGRGFSPDVSVSTIDFHSTLQLRLGGPAITATSVLNVLNDPAALAWQPGAGRFLDASLSGKSAGTIRDAIIEGVTGSLTARKIPVQTIVLEDVSARALGEYMATLMIETILVARLWEINAFDQPEVEAYKVAARTTLLNNPS